MHPRTAFVGSRTLLVLAVTPANKAKQRQVDVLYADADCTAGDAAAAAKQHGIHLVVVKRSEASKGFVPLPPVCP